MVFITLQLRLTMLGFRRVTRVPHEASNKSLYPRVNHEHKQNKPERLLIIRDFPRHIKPIKPDLFEIVFKSQTKFLSVFNWFDFHSIFACIKSEMFCCLTNPQ